MLTDISLYTANPDKYNEIQNLRPDYKQAIETAINLSVKYLQDKGDISLADFCGGTGTIVKKLADIIRVKKASIIDINQEFLKIATNSKINIQDFQTTCSDIINVKLKKEFDLVLSIFAYHHVPDDKKEKYLIKALNGLKAGGILVLTEIYLPNQEVALQYYLKLIREINNIPYLLNNFLLETAKSTNYEFKVSKKFADNQLTELGFKELECVKIWPLDNTFSENIGTFVQVFRAN